jgi:ABC-type lipoprotein export system ATPase subunit
MTLTVCVGASGSGKTTFLNDVHKSHKCTYIRQYHNLRPYIKVSSIPNFDPTVLPYWDIYVKENKTRSVIVGGTIAGQFMPGLSGGQRKLLLFELIFQRTAMQDNLLIVLDEPFAGVTDDFVPFIVGRLNEMRKKHNILLVTNDHVETLKSMADNTVTVSAIDRSKVKINDKEGVDRELTLLAMSIGDGYTQGHNNSDLKFFCDVEFSKNGGVPFIAGFGVFSFGLFLLMFWDSQPGTEALVLVAAGIISFFIANPYFLQLTDWRIFMCEEAEALLHSSKSMNRFLKMCLAITLLWIISSIQFICQNLIIDTLNNAYFYFAILFDNLSLMVAILCLSLYTDLPDQAVQILGSMPFLFMIFFSTTFSPGAGVEGVKNLRYLFSRYYLWCEVPGVKDLMEGCPEQYNLLYLILAALLVPLLFVAYMIVRGCVNNLHHEKAATSRRESMKSMAFAELQVELFGEKALRRLQHIGSSVDIQKLASSHDLDSSVASSFTNKDSDDDEESV